MPGATASAHRLVLLEHCGEWAQQSSGEVADARTQAEA
jgi:hypothetical protein